MADTFIFGYGSLVNRATHDYETTFPARLSGWRRAWRHTDQRPAAFLTANRDQASFIDGVIIQVPPADPALDRREFAYERHDVSGDVSHNHTAELTIEIYAIAANDHRDRTGDHPVWLSYIDVVVQRYYRQYGAAGVQHFFATTDHWDTPVIDDRHRPQYPRHQRLTEVETSLTDQGLRRSAAVVKKLE